MLIFMTIRIIYLFVLLIFFHISIEAQNIDECFILEAQKGNFYEVKRLLNLGANIDAMNNHIK